MPDAKTYTEKDLVLAKREAYMLGRHESLTVGHMTLAERAAYARDAASRYPLPKVTRARLVEDPHDDGGWYVEDGEVLWTATGNARCGVRIEHTKDFQRKTLRAITPARVAVWSDLLANPTEEVEEVEDA